MKTIEVKLYKINELSEESKKIAIEREKKEEKEFYIDTCMEKYLTEYVKELLQENFKETDEETEKRLLEQEYYFYSNGSFYGVI